MNLRFYEEAQPSKTIAILAGKGGVGKSTVVTHLAYALRDKGLRVGVLDADLYGPSMGTMFQEDQPISTDEGRIRPAICTGIARVTVSDFPEIRKNLGFRAPLANQMLKHLLKAIDWGSLDYLLIDFPPGIGDIPLTMLQEAKLSGAIAVTTPQKIAQIDVEKALAMCHNLSVPLLGVVENMSFMWDENEKRRMTLFEGDGGEVLSQRWEIPLLAQLPLDSGVAKCCDRGVGLARGLAKDLFQELAEKTLMRLKDFKGIPLSARLISDEQIALSRGDELHVQLKASSLQSHCPCAKCRDKKGMIDEDVKILELENVGHYALRFRFSSGCSKGIYPFSLLENLNG